MNNKPGICGDLGAGYKFSSDCSYYESMGKGGGEQIENFNNLTNCRN